MQDAHFGHRSPSSGKQITDGWTEWDYALASAYQVIEDHTDENGLLIWERQAENVQVDAVKKVDRFRQQVERVTSKKSYKSTPGEYFTPKLELIDGDWPTRMEFIKSELGIDDDD